MRRPIKKLDAEQSAPLTATSDTTPVQVTVPVTLHQHMHAGLCEDHDAPPLLTDLGSPPAPAPQPSQAPGGGIWMSLIRTTEHGPPVVCKKGKHHKHEGKATTRGVLRVFVGGAPKLTIQTLEPPGPDSTEVGSQLRIPAGTYAVRRPHPGEVGHGSRLLLIGSAMGKRSVVEIHEGNGGCDSTGCILTGLTLSKGGVQSSRPALAMVRALVLEGQEATLVIESRFTEGGHAESQPTR